MMKGRTISDSTRAWLLGEMEVWRANGLVSQEQSGRILDLYESSVDVAQRKHSMAIFALMSVAAFLVGLAVLLLIGYNWDAMPAAVKLAIIFGVIIGMHSLGFWLRYRSTANILSEVAFFLGCIFYGCGIWLIAQIFHFQSHYPDGLWFWALGVLPVALCLDTLLVHALFVALLATWVGTEILGFDEFLRPLFFGRWFHVPGGCYTLPWLALPGLLWAYRKWSPATVGLYLPLLAWWVILQSIAWQVEVNPIYFIGAAGALFLAFAECHPTGSSMAMPYRLYGVLIAAGVLVPLSFGRFISEMLHEYPAAPGIVAGLLIALAGMGALILADRFRWERQASNAPAPSFPLAEMLRRQWLPIGIILLMAGLCVWNSLYSTHGTNTRYSERQTEVWSVAVLLPTLVTNICMIAFAVWLMHIGLREDQSRPFTAGVLLFLLWAVLRYVDLFAEVGGMLGASVMFLLCGVALFGVARFWMHRKEIANVG
jgi:uncharacterized membrane protein